MLEFELPQDIQPQDAREANPSYPIAWTGLVDFAQRRFLRGTSYAQQGSLAYALTPAGIATQHGSNVTQQQINGPQALNVPLSGFAVFSVPEVSASERRCLDNSASPGANSCYITTSSAGIRLYWNNTLSCTGPVPVVGQVYAIGWAGTDGDQRLYVDGLEVATGTTASGGALWVGGYLRLTGAPFGSPYQLRALLGGFVIANFADEAIRRVTENPWQVFATQDIWVPVSASSPGTNIAPGAGSIAITGYAPAVAQSANQAITPGVGSVVITGYAPTVSQSGGLDILPGAGAVAITGYAPSVTQSANQDIQPDVGNITITGYAPTVVQASASVDITPDAGQIVITGYAPRIDQTVTQTGGGVPNWSHRKSGETDEQKRVRREAQGIIAKARRVDADIEQLAEQAKPIAAMLRADVDRLERAAESYKAEIGKRATKRLMNARNDALATRQLEQKLIASQLQAEQQAQQLEELDMVFIIALVAMEDES